MSKVKIDDKLLKRLDLYTEDPKANTESKAKILVLVDKRLQDKIFAELNGDDKKLKEYTLVVGKEDLYSPWVEKNLPEYDLLVQESLGEIVKEFEGDLKVFDKAFVEQQS